MGRSQKRATERRSSGQCQQHVSARTLRKRTLCKAEWLSPRDPLTGLADIRRTVSQCDNGRTNFPDKPDMALGWVCRADLRRTSSWARSRGWIPFQKGGGLRPPPFWRVSRPPGAAQTPNIDDFRSAKKIIYQNLRCLDRFVHFCIRDGTRRNVMCGAGSKAARRGAG